ncbi:MAG: translation initiation factor IF-2 [Planctomycetota bacterium]
MQKEKVRLYLLAKELEIDCKELIDLCKGQGWDVKNQLSSIEPEQRDQLVQIIKRGGSKPAAAPAPAPEPPRPNPVGSVPPLRPPVLGRPPKSVAPPPRPASPAKPAAEAAAVETPVVPAKVEAHAEQPASAKPAQETEKAPAPVEQDAHAKPAQETETAPAPFEPPAPKSAEPQAPVNVEPPAAAKPPAPVPGVARPIPGNLPNIRPSGPVRPLAPGGRMPELGSGPRPPMGPGGQRGPVGPAPAGGSRIRMDGGGRPVPGGARPVPGGAPQGSGPSPVAPRVPVPLRPVPPRQPLGPGGPSGGMLRPRPPESNLKAGGPSTAGIRKLADIPADLQKTGGPIGIEDVTRAVQAKSLRNEAGAVVEEDEEGAKKPGAPGPRRGPGGVAGRADRHRERAEKQVARRSDGTPDLRVNRIADFDEDNPRHRRLGRKPKHASKVATARKGKVPIAMPITVRSLSEAIGMKTGELLMKLMSQGVAGVNINSTLENEMAQLIALDAGIELDVKADSSSEEELLKGLIEEAREEDLVPRAPIVTIMGHVDHGKTSLLDRIRKSNVVSTEAGGITQVLRAWRVEHNGKPATFLDTPGHEAFTKMRARGANVTDIAVIVVAADDGVMPQTEEAISHAKAAGVKIIVAINKVDLPNANIRKTEQMLYGMGLIPDSMGGDVPFVQTSAATGKGIDELLDTIALVAELEELKAAPDKRATGLCLEAHISEGQGVTATFLVQDGTLRKGDILLCGATFGRARMMYDDLGRPIDEAGPSMPVQLMGLEEVPNADDTFLVVPELQVAREIAEQRRVAQSDALQVRRVPVAFGAPGSTEIVELKVILKADFRGSVEAIRKEIEKLQHDEVKVRLLHAAVGGITESDVQLALTSPDDTIIVGFNAVPDDNALRLADERGVSIREYDIIYKLAADLKSALEGKLKPREEIVHLGRTVVREVFKISRVGTIAGCFVTQGTIERSARVRLIRGGVVVYPPADRSASLESLKRFKDDVREVREGLECGLKIAGYDDIKVDDVIEAFRVEQIQRTLS